MPFHGIIPAAVKGACTFIQQVSQSSLATTEGENAEEMARQAAERMSYINFERVFLTYADPEVLAQVSAHSIHFIIWHSSKTLASKPTSSPASACVEGCASLRPFLRASGYVYYIIIDCIGVYLCHRATWTYLVSRRTHGKARRRSTVLLTSTNVRLLRSICSSAVTFLAGNSFHRLWSAIQFITCYSGASAGGSDTATFAALTAQCHSI